MTGIRDHVVLLVGGVGGAKLALGLANVLPPEALTIIVNTADDLEHLGLHISPDVDTVMYTLSGLSNQQSGWGVAGDTLQAMEMVKRYGGPAWFNLGDKDIGTNLMRTTLLREGHTLTEVTRRLSEAVGIGPDLLPMTDDTVRTVLDTDIGELAFQEYFVREGWQPAVREICFDGADMAQPSQAVADALDAATLIVFGPSNPFLSIDPILSIRGIHDRIAGANVPRVAVTPIIGGQAVKGPTAKLMTELDLDVSPLGVARHYRELLDGFILDVTDEDQIASVEALDLRAAAQQTYMRTLQDKLELAEALLSWVEGFSS